MLKKSGSKTPRVEVEEIGPSFDFEVRRLHLAADSLYKEAMKQPKALKVRCSLSLITLFSQIILFKLDYIVKHSVIYTLVLSPQLLPWRFQWLGIMKVQPKCCFFWQRLFSGDEKNKWILRLVSRQQYSMPKRKLKKEKENREKIDFNPLTPGVCLNVNHKPAATTCSPAGLFKYIWPLSGDQALKS